MNKESKIGKEMRNHIVIYSSGRSGSNRLLDILDQHGRTNCRNEPDADDPEIGNLWSATKTSGLPEDFFEQWANLIENSAVRKGARDRYDYLENKMYLRPFLGKLWVELARRGKLRFLLFGKSGNVWPISRMALKKDNSASILPVLKVSGLPMWFIEPHFAIQNQWIVHNMRSPQEYLNSWYNRFVRKSGLTDEEMYNLVLESRSWMRRQAGLPEFSSPYSFRDLLAVELWGWRFMNETLYEALNGSPRYLPIRYHDVSKDKIAVARRIFDFVGLEFGSRERERIDKMQQTLFTNPHVEKLDQGLVNDVIDEILGDSSLRSFLS